jgi:hypothetical protein
MVANHVIMLACHGKNFLPWQANMMTMPYKNQCSAGSSAALCAHGVRCRYDSYGRMAVIRPLHCWSGVRATHSD